MAYYVLGARCVRAATLFILRMILQLKFSTSSQLEIFDMHALSVKALTPTLPMPYLHVFVVDRECGWSLGVCVGAFGHMRWATFTHNHTKMPLQPHTKM